MIRLPGAIRIRTGRLATTASATSLNEADKDKALSQNVFHLASDDAPISHGHAQTAIGQIHHLPEASLFQRDDRHARYDTGQTQLPRTAPTNPVLQDKTSKTLSQDRLSIVRDNASTRHGHAQTTVEQRQHSSGVPSSRRDSQHAWHDTGQTAPIILASQNEPDDALPQRAPPPRNPASPAPNVARPPPNRPLAPQMADNAR